MKKQQRILVFRFSSLGDVALCVPVVLQVLEQNPKLQIDFATPKFMHHLFPNHTRLNLIEFDKNNKHQGFWGLINFLKSLDLNQYDAIADLHEVLRTKVLSKLSQLRGKKVVSIDKDRKSRKALILGENVTQLKHTTQKYADVFRKLGLSLHLNTSLQNFLFDDITKSGKIGVAPFARHQGKMFPIDKLKEVVHQIAAIRPVIVYGSAEELNSIADWKQIPQVSFCEEANLKEELRQMASLDLMLSMDSANMHLASLVGVRVISIWGVTHPYAGFLGYGQSMADVIQDESCTWRPTSVYGNKLGPDENPTGFKNISTEVIVDKVLTALNQSTYV